MIQNFQIDQARTFGSVLFLGVEPKTAFGDPYRQETAKDGTPKWVAQVAAEFRAFGRPQRELINVGLTAARTRVTGWCPRCARGTGCAASGCTIYGTAASACSWRSASARGS